MNELCNLQSLTLYILYYKSLISPLQLQRMPREAFAGFIGNSSPVSESLHEIGDHEPFDDDDENKTPP